MHRPHFFFLLLLALGLAPLRVAAVQTYWFDSAPFTTYAEFNPSPLNTSTTGGHTVKQLQASGSLRFYSRSATVGINSYTSTAAGRTYVLLQDGVEVGSVAIPASGGGSYVTYALAAGLDTAAVHFYEILCITPIRLAAGNWFDAYLELDDANGLAAVAVPARQVYCFYGDSVTGITVGGVTDTRVGDMWQATQAAGRAMCIAAVGGGKVNTVGRDGTAAIPTNVDQVHVRYGINDLPDLPAGNAAFQAAYFDMVDNIRSRIGAGKPIYCYQPQPVVGGSQRANAGALIQAAIVGKADVYYLSTDNWYPTTVGYLPDGTHPNAACYFIYGNREVPIFSATALTLTGPATGSAGYASGAFTLALANAATFTGDQAITLTASGGAITATSAGGTITGNGSATVAVTPAAAGSVTFTYKATVAGSATTLTPTTAQARWTMPAATTYSATGATAGQPRAFVP